MFMIVKGVFADPLRHAMVKAALVSHAWPRLAADPFDAYFMGSQALLDPIAAVPFIGATSHGREQ